MFLQSEAKDLGGSSAPSEAQTTGILRRAQDDAGEGFPIQAPDSRRGKISS